VNFVDLDVIAVGTEGEVLKPQGGGCLKFDFLEPDLENFVLAPGMGGLVENPPDMTEIIHPRGFVFERNL